LGVSEFHLSVYRAALGCAECKERRGEISVLRHGLCNSHCWFITFK